MRNLLIVLVVVLLAVAAGLTWWLTQRKPTVQSNKTQSSTTTRSQKADERANAEAQLLELDTAKAYGDKYANGLLPVGDNKYTTTAAEKGKIFLCNANFVPAEQAGAQKRGPWFVNNNTQWDIKKKAAIAGTVNWQHNMIISEENGQRIIATNDLPDHHTGTFPVAATDSARVYDANPNSISEQSLTYTLPASPTPGSPQCMGGEVGVMLTGSALFNGFDAGGRDAGAWEVQDSCDGHPQSSGVYHYHTLSRCIKDISVHTVIGYALDGFPITGPQVGPGNVLTTNDLDECHGIVSEVSIGRTSAKTYHYVMTEDFPYSASCFRSQAVQSPAQHAGGGQTRGSRPPAP